jgi:hypothetical protein
MLSSHPPPPERLELALLGWAKERVRAEARTMELRAVAQLGRAAARRPVPPCRRAPPPQQHPARRCMAAASSAVAPQSRRQASDIALRRRACASPTLSMRALPALTPCARRLNTPSEPARGSSYRPRPLQRGAQQRHHRWLYQSFHQSLLVARGAPVIFPTHLNFDLKNDPHSRGGPDSRG